MNGQTTAKRTNASAGAGRKYPTKEEIAERAYQLFLQHGGSQGSKVDDGDGAERELQQKLPNCCEALMGLNNRGESETEKMLRRFFDCLA